MTISQDNKIVVSISGELGFATVPKLSKSNRKLILENKGITFDLSRVTFSDNTGVAFLIALVSFSKSVQKDISFINVPAQLFALIEAVGVKELLPILR